jgi:dTMP kinase
MNGIFITLEGIDGAGKSSHIAALQELLECNHKEVVVTREPGGTELAEQLREMILHQSMDTLTEVLMVFAARRDHLMKCIEPALKRGAVVLCDRFTDATFAYQGAGRGFDLAVLQQLERWVQAELAPDLTLLFDLSPAIAAQRRAAVREPDRFEQLQTEFFEQVRQGYMHRVELEPQRFVVLDAQQAPVQVWQDINAAMLARGY